MKKILITGVSGYIGSNLARKLIDNKTEVHALILPDINFEYLEDIKDRIAFHIYNGTTESVFDAVKKSEPDIVYHLASLFLSEHRSDDIINLIKSNVLLGTQMLEAMSKNGIHKIINTGTSWQHYLNQDYNPVNLYAATKQAFEDILRYYTEAGFISAITLHLFDTYGPGDNRPKLFKLLKNAAENNQTLNMSPGEQLIDLVYIDDVVNAFQIAGNYLLQKNDIINTVYGISSGNPIPLKQIVDQFNETYYKKVSVNWGGRPYRKREVMKTWNKYNSLPGWETKTSLKIKLKEPHKLSQNKNDN